MHSADLKRFLNEIKRELKAGMVNLASRRASARAADAVENKPQAAPSTSAP
jgi:hypothetical protein